MPIIEIIRKHPDRSHKKHASFTLNKSGAKINLFKASVNRLLESDVPFDQPQSLRIFFDDISRVIFMKLDTDGEFTIRFRKGTGFIHVPEFKPHIAETTNYKLLLKDQLSSLPNDLLFSKKYDFALVPISKPQTQIKKIKAAS